MRPELEQLARIDAYVNKTMDAAEIAAFEAEMQSDPAVYEAVQTQQLLVTTIQRKALMAYVTAATPPPTVPPRDGSFLSHFKWPIILSSVVIGAIVSWFAFDGDNKKTVESHEPSHPIQQRISQSPTVADKAVDSVIPQKVAFTYEPTKTTSIQPTYQRTFGGLETWIAPELQQITIDPTKQELVQCADGTLILVPENAFVDADGNTITQPVTLEIIEALTLDKMVAYNLTTMSNGHALETGGMVYIQPKLNGTTVTLAEEKAIHIEIPAENYNPNMKAWEGIPDGNGNLNWENPQEIENYLIPVAMESLDFLPEGFREEVAATLPFRGYVSSSKKLEDSLYYSLGGNISDIEEETLGDRIRPQKKSKNPFTRLRGGKRSKKERIPSGAAVLQFDHLSMHKTVGYSVTFFIGKEEIRSSLFPGTNRLTTDFIGVSNVTVYNSRCEGITFKNVAFKEGEITVLNCSEWQCNGSNGVATAETADTTTTCYINPSSVSAIYNTAFENTFIATKAFQERLQALHKIENAQPLFDLYVNQLEKNLHEIDAQVADRLAGENKILFEQFAREKLTNVKPEGQEFARLKQFYSDEVIKEKNRVAQQQREYNRKSAEALEEIQQEIIQRRLDFEDDQRSIRRRYDKKSASILKKIGAGNFASAPKRVVRNVKPNVAQRASYKVNWYTTGWVNIDSYLHLLSKGEKQIPIAVSKSAGTKIYQSINSLNTLLGLNNTTSGYTAHFPDQPSSEFENSLAIGIRRTNGKLKLSAQFFNPYAVRNVALKQWEDVSEKEFKQRLKTLYPGGAQMLKELEREEQQIQLARERQQRAEKQRQLMEEAITELQQEFETNNAELTEKQRTLQEQQAKERAYVQHLSDFINPCTNRNSEPFTNTATEVPLSMANSSVTDNSELQLGSWDVSPQYVGGFLAMNDFIKRNIRYPQKAIDQGISGKVHLQVTLDNRGKVREVKVLRSEPKSTLLEEEAIRVVMSMPKWKPAQRNGVFVASRTTVPVNFFLD